MNHYRLSREEKDDLARLRDAAAPRESAP